MNAPAEGNTSRGLLDYLRSRGVKIWLEDGNKIRLVAPWGLLNEPLKQSLKEHKADIIALLENHGSGATGEHLTPDPKAKLEPFPLTDIQRAYWVGRQQAFDFGDVSIHFYTEVECRDLDIQGLEKAWNQVVRRHDMLRAIVKDDGEQQILPEVDWYHVRVNRLTNLSEQETLERLGQIRGRLSHSRRATDEWPGFGVEVSILDERRARLHISIDLLHVDGASLHILFDDWSSYYKDESTLLPPLTLSYR
ncbi:MAG: condensation domain-containing protein, partial [Gammaproteobacteria bacterium]